VNRDIVFNEDKVGFHFLKETKQNHSLFQSLETTLTEKTSIENVDNLVFPKLEDDDTLDETTPKQIIEPDETPTQSVKSPTKSLRRPLLVDYQVGPKV